jgi:iron-sulfur cluster repair protein YtfE (RIC family)
MCGQSGENETQCSVCGWLGNSRLLAPLPAVLVKLQNEHESILEQSRTLLKSVEGTTRTSHKKGTVSRNLTVRYFAGLKKLVTEHQREEERILIPIVDKYLGCNVSESLRHEHTEISAATKQQANPS